MQLFLDSFGAYLGVRNGLFWVKPRQGEGRAIAARDLHAIFFTRGVTVSSDALIMAIQEQIPVLLINRIGHPIGQVWSGRFGSISTIRKNQALLATHSEGLAWIREVLLQKIAQQRDSTQALRESPHQSPEFPWLLVKALNAYDKMEENFMGWKPRSRMRHDEDAASFRGWEGTASKAYFQCLSAALPERYRFDTRSKRPAFDPFNALLNYLYGITYALVELALMKAGLDPYTGILHADEYNRPTLVFDMIEIYRHWAEAVAFNLCADDRLPEGSFVTGPQDGGIWLGNPGKGIVIDSFFRYLDVKILYKDQSRRRITHIDLDALRFAALLKTFEPPK